LAFWYISLRRSRRKKTSRELSGSSGAAAGLLERRVAGRAPAGGGEDAEADSDAAGFDADGTVAVAGAARVRRRTTAPAISAQRARTRTMREAREPNAD
jgi:hypothetical protein